MIRDALAQVITSLPSIQGAPEPKNPAALVAYLFTFAMTLTGIAVFIAFLTGAVRYFTSAGNPSAIQDGRDRMLHALLGFFVLIFAVATLYAINPDLVRLRNPGLARILLSRSPAGAAPPCELVDAQWAGEGVPGEEVGLVVDGVNCPQGSTVILTVLNASGQLIGVQFTAQISASGEASAVWRIPQTTQPGTTFFFEARLDAKQIFSNALEVVPGPFTVGPLPVDCTNPAISDPLPQGCAAPCAATVIPPAFPYTCTSIVQEAARKFGIPAGLIVAIMQKECPSGNPACGGVGGRCGLMGVLPGPLFDPASPLKACQRLLGPGASDPGAACIIMAANPNIAVEVGACMLEIAMREAAREKSQNNYPIDEIAYTAAAYHYGLEANEPSCNCRNAGDTTLPPGCTQDASTVCKNCFTTIPKWLCALDSPQPGTCARNTSFDATRQYAATINAWYAHYASCPAWQAGNCSLDFSKTDICVGDAVTWRVTSSPEGLRAWWHGTKDTGSGPVTDFIDGFEAQLTNFSETHIYPCSEVGTYTRHLHIEKDGVHDYCTTNTLIGITVRDCTGVCAGP